MPDALQRLASLLIGSLVALVLGALGVVFVAVSVMIAAGDEHRLAAAALLALAFLAGGAAAAYRVRSNVRELVVLGQWAAGVLMLVQLVRGLLRSPQRQV